MSSAALESTLPMVDTYGLNAVDVVLALYDQAVSAHLGENNADGAEYLDISEDDAREAIWKAWEGDGIIYSLGGLAIDAPVRDIVRGAFDPTDYNLAHGEERAQTAINDLRDLVSEEQQEKFDRFEEEAGDVPILDFVYHGQDEAFYESLRHIILNATDTSSRGFRTLIQGRLRPEYRYETTFEDVILPLVNAYRLQAAQCYTEKRESWLRVNPDLVTDAEDDDSWLLDRPASQRQAA